MTQPTDEEIRELWSQYNPLHGIQSFARAVLAKWGAPQQEAPAGWVLVPVEPTPEMFEACYRYAVECDACGERSTPWPSEAKKLFQSMVAAAHKAPQQAAQAGWIDPNDKTQAQYLPHIGEPVLFCCDGVTYYGKHTGGSFVAGAGCTQKSFSTWDCRWQYPPVAHGIKGGQQPATGLVPLAAVLARVDACAGPGSAVRLALVREFGRAS